MATKFYLSTLAAGYTPATIRGTWNDTAAAVTNALRMRKDNGGAVTSVATSEVSATTPYDILLYRGVTNKLAHQTIAGTVNVMLAAREFPATADYYWHLHIYVTTGDSDTPRGTLLSNYVENTTNEIPASSVGLRLQADSALSSVAILDGDRIVVEIGVIARNSDTNTNAVRLFYGTQDTTNRYGHAVLALGPNNYFRLNEASGAVANDSGSDNDDGTISGSPTMGTVVVHGNLGITFDGSNDEVTFAGAALGGTWTIGVLFTPDESGGDADMKLLMGGGVVDGLFYNKASHTFRFNVDSATQNSSVVVASGTLCHVMVCTINNVSKMYVNNVLAATFTSRGWTPDAISTTGFRAKGLLSDVFAIIGGGLLQRDAVLALSPTNYWILDEMSGTNANDLGSGNDDGVISGSPTLDVPSNVGWRAMRFDEVNDQITYAGVAASTSTFSVSAWVKVDESGATTYMDILANAGFNSGLFYRTDTHKFLHADSAVEKPNTTTLTDGLWYHVVVSCLAGAGTIYINGVADGTFSSGATWTPGQTSAGNRVKGDMSDLAYWSGVALTAVQVKTLYDARDPAIVDDSVAQTAALYTALTTGSPAGAADDLTFGGRDVLAGYVTFSDAFSELDFVDVPSDDIAGSTVAVAWVEFALETEGATTTYVWAKVALPDPASYFQGFKDARLVSFGEFNRALSDNRGNYEGADFSFQVSDTDRLIRGLMAGSATKYGFTNRGLTVRLITDAGRRLLQQPRTVVRGLMKQVTPQPGLMASFAGVDFVTSKFSSANIDKQIPQRLWGDDFPSAPSAARKLAVPIVYGRTSDEASTALPPVIDGQVAEGAYVGVTGFGPLTSSAAVPAGVSINSAAGGTLSADVPNGEYGVIVTAVDSSGRETSPHVFYYNGENDTRGSFADGAMTGVSVDGTKKIQVSWGAAAGASKYRVYLGWYYFGVRWQQWIETTGLSCEFTTNPSWGTATTLANITPGANLIRYAYDATYAVMAVMADGNTGISQTVIGRSGPYRRPLRVRWLPVASALSYLVVRKTTGDFDRQWPVVAAASNNLFDDDMLDTGVTFLTTGVGRPQGAVPVIYLGQVLDDFGTPWERFGICGHAVKAVPAWFLGGVLVAPTTAGVTWLVPGRTGYSTFFAATAASGGLYHDVGTSRYALLHVRGPEAADAVADIRAITVNVDGVEATGDGAGALLTNVFDQYKHFVKNFGFQNYRTGAYLSAPTLTGDATVSLVDETSFDNCRTLAAARLSGGYVGAGVIGNKGTRQTLREWVAHWNVSAGVESGFNRQSQFFLSMIAATSAGATEFTQLTDILEGSFSIQPQRDKLFNVHPYVCRKRWRDETWEIDDVDVRSSASITGYGEEFVAPVTELWMVRDVLTAENIMAWRLQFAKEPPNLVTFSVPLVGLNVDIGDLIRVTHSEGIGSSGWDRTVCRVHRHSVNLDTLSVRLECYDASAVFAPVSGSASLVAEHAIIAASNTAVTGTGAGAAKKATFAATGSQATIGGSAALTAKKATSASSGTEIFTGTAVLDAKLAAMAASGTSTDPDDEPDAFDFGSKFDQATFTVIESANNPVTIAGINMTVNVSIVSSNGTGEYKINAGAWTTAAGTLVVGDTVSVRITTGDAGTMVDLTLTVGSGSGYFSVTTSP